MGDCFPTVTSSFDPFSLLIIFSVSLSGRGCRVSDGVPAGWALLQAVTAQRTWGRSDCDACASNAAAFRVFWCSFSKHPSMLWTLFSAAVNIPFICLCYFNLYLSSCLSLVLVFCAGEWTGLLCGGEAGISADSVRARPSVVCFSQWFRAVILAHGSTQAAAVCLELSRCYGVFRHGQGSRLQHQTGGVRDCVFTQHSYSCSVVETIYLCGLQLCFCHISWQWI